MKKIVVLSGSIRAGRKSHFVAEAIAHILKEKQAINTVMLDLKKYPLPIMETRIDKATILPPGIQDFSNQLVDAKGIVIVSPEYKSGIPGSLKNAFDYLAPQIFKRIPIGIATVSSGGFGGINCLSQLRQVSLALGGIPIPEKLCISKVNDVFDENGNLINDTFTEKVTEFVDSFLWYADRLSAQ